MFKRIATAALIFGMAALAPPASAQTACGPHEAVAAGLADRFGETLLGRGLRDPVSMFEVWTSAEGGTWTIVLTRPDGLTCILAAGVAWSAGPAAEVKGEGASWTPPAR